ncbi:hypothetical protein OS493_040316 [Desmophyllum pertusum]|uniref:Uncharacterized protein n=1 Tax=Desmophyllum pertusum TaxID=174260 RepID=A0A9W9ZUB6_9CNID|nr:hypothetical protein OS493_040316 [Desmophyllum pertusum]
MENNFVSKNKFTDLEEVEDEVTPPFIRIYSIPTKTGERKDETDENSGGSRVSSPVEMARDRLSQNLSNSCGSEGSWALSRRRYCRGVSITRGVDATAADESDSRLGEAATQARPIRSCEWLGPAAPFKSRPLTATPATTLSRRGPRHRVTITTQKESEGQEGTEEACLRLSERVTEEKQISSILNRKIVTQQIEFLPPIPEPYAKRRPEMLRNLEWHTM